MANKPKTTEQLQQWLIYVQCYSEDKVSVSTNELQKVLEEVIVSKNLRKAEKQIDQELSRPHKIPVNNDIHLPVLKEILKVLHEIKQQGYTI